MDEVSKHFVTASRFTVRPINVIAHDLKIPFFLRKQSIQGYLLQKESTESLIHSHEETE
jgi:hypothetical protein